MDVVERLRLEAAHADTMVASADRHRYELAARLCAGKRVLDLCCGAGYGTAILADHAREVVGVDNDAAAVETARQTIGREAPNVSVELADALAVLGTDDGWGYDVVVCFEGIERLGELDRALALLRAHAERGTQIIASVRNRKMLDGAKPSGVTQFGYDEARAAFAAFPNAVMIPQFLAEGSLICPPGATDTMVSLSLESREEPEYANYFIFFVGFEPDEVERAHNGQIQLSTGPAFNREVEDLRRGIAALRRENARLARGRLGKGGSAAASALTRVAEREARVAEREARVAELEARCAAAETRVKELEEEVLAKLGAEPATARSALDSEAEVAGIAPTIAAVPVPVAPGENPNTWEHRRRRAAEVMIPWIEQTVPLAEATVLEYGCGNAAVTCAVAERAGRVIGIDIDPGWIKLGNERVSRRGLRNVELEQHPVESVLDAVAGRRGEVDVFLLYAVLEHLTVAERLAVLRLAREVVKPDGVIVVCETPNRLIYFDHHSAQMPFFGMLPDELAADCYERSPRPDFKAAMDDAAHGGREALLQALTRWGRGVSFHEFELAFDDRLGEHVIASNYDPLLFAERPIQPDEVILARYLERWLPDLAPVWSRYWLDLILSPRPLERRPSFLRPWSADTTESKGVGWTNSERLRLRGPDATLWINLPQPTSRLVVGSITNDGRWVSLTVQPQGAHAALLANHRAPANIAAYSSFMLPQPASRIALRSSEPCELVFVGYED